MSSYGLWLSAAGMMVNDHQQTLLTNNMANMQTPGFKHDLAVVTQRRVESQVAPGGMMAASPVMDSMTGGVNVRPAFWSHQQGPIETTGRPLDVAIDGDGFFAVHDGKDTRFTRNGALTVNSGGELALSTESGRWKIVDGNSGGPIVIDPANPIIEVSSDGTVRQGDTVAGKIDLRAPAEPRLLKKFGENLFEPDGTEMKPINGKLRSGALEGSSFDVTNGLAYMIQASRAYQINASMLQMQDDVTGRVMELGKAA
ncbi:MAG: flagellar hook-basal body protein [Planctomycetes bacterium]|nr:flagellar hook-basal body protein [Planctomycetota bacterium]MBI3833883.1 flagellar hook-basal body protein [Planctomycetota bacterium]